MVKYYRQQIDNLQQQSDAIDKQISNLQNAKNGKTVDSTRTYNPWGGVQGDWNAQIEQIQKKAKTTSRNRSIPLNNKSAGSIPRS